LSPPLRPGVSLRAQRVESARTEARTRFHRSTTVQRSDTPEGAGFRLRRSWSAYAGLRLADGSLKSRRPLVGGSRESRRPLAGDSRRSRRPHAAATRLTLAQSVAALEDDSRLRTARISRERPEAHPTPRIGASRFDSRISVAAPELPPELRVRRPSPEGDDCAHPGATTGVIPAHEVAVPELPPTPGSALHPPERGAARIRTTTGVTLALGVAAGELPQLHRACQAPSRERAQHTFKRHDRRDSAHGVTALELPPGAD